jgi:hypothetical protein
VTARPPHPGREGSGRNRSAALRRIRDGLRGDMRVLRWVFAGLYALIVLCLLARSVAGDDEGLALLILLLGMIAAQALFVLGSGTVDLCRPVRPRRFWIPLVVAATMMGLLGFGLFLSFAELFRLADAVERSGTEWIGITLFWTAVGGNWLLWGVLIFVYARRWRRYALLWRLTGMLFGGSLLELVAAVPSHMVVMRRPGCMVGLGTGIGVMAGVCVMFVAFGPAVVLLFLRPRYRREVMEGRRYCPACEYDLRGTPGRGVCPECGRPVDA